MMNCCNLSIIIHLGELLGESRFWGSERVIERSVTLEMGHIRVIYQRIVFLGKGNNAIGEGGICFLREGRMGIRRGRIF